VGRCLAIARHDRVERHNKKGCHPEAQAEGSPWDVVPKEVRGASLMLGRTKEGARQDKNGGSERKL